MAMINATKVVAVAGTREPLTVGSVLVKQVVIQVLSTNTGKVYIGDNTVVATVAIELGFPISGVLLPSIRMRPVSVTSSLDLHDLYIDVSVSGEGVQIFYEPF
jgi:hypothetical protein